MGSDLVEPLPRVDKKSVAIEVAYVCGVFVDLTKALGTGSGNHEL